MRDLQPAVYILASAPNGTLYVGVTSNLIQRIWQRLVNDFNPAWQDLGPQVLGDLGSPPAPR